jgi:hypothetical protein
MIAMITDKDISVNDRYKYLENLIATNNFKIFHMFYNFCINNTNISEINCSELMRFRYILVNYYIRRKDDIDPLYINSSEVIQILSELIRKALLFEYETETNIYNAFMSSLYDVTCNYDPAKGGYISYLLSFWKFDLVEHIIIPAIKAYTWHTYGFGLTDDTYMKHHLKNNNDYNGYECSNRVSDWFKSDKQSLPFKFCRYDSRFKRGVYVK